MNLKTFQYTVDSSPDKAILILFSCAAHVKQYSNGKRTTPKIGSNSRSENCA